MAEFGLVFENLINAIKRAGAAPQAKKLLAATKSQQKALEERFEELTLNGEPLTKKYEETMIRTGE